MGQEQSTYISPFATPPLMIDTDALARNWLTQEPPPRNTTHTRRRRRSSIRRHSHGGEQVASLLGADDSHDADETASATEMTSPEVTLVTVRRRDGDEVVVSRDIAYGTAVRLANLQDQEEVIFSFSDRSQVRLSAEAIIAKAGMGEMLCALEGRPRGRSRSIDHTHELAALPPHPSQQRHHELVCRVENALAPSPPVSGQDQLALVLPQMVNDREVHLALILVNMACWHQDLTGVTLLLLGLMLVAEAFKRHAGELERGGGGRQRQQQLLRAVAWDLELVAERCMSRQRSLTRTTTTTTTTTTTASTTTTVLRRESVMLVEEERALARAGGVLVLDEGVPETASAAEMVEAAAAAMRVQRRASDVTITTRRALSTVTSAMVEEILEQEDMEEEVRVEKEEEEEEEEIIIETTSTNSSVTAMYPATQSLAKPPMPMRYLIVTRNNFHQAQDKWDATLKWRATYGADTILDRPHVHYPTIKKFFPQFLAGKSKSGYPVYYEMNARIDIKSCLANGVDVDEMIYQYVWMNEYIYTRYVTDIDAQIITVVDVGGLSMGGMSARSVEFITRALHLIQNYYPARAQVILLVNAPFFFSYIWSIVKGAADEYTSKTVKVVTTAQTFSTLCEYIEADQIPVEYGGTLSYAPEAGAPAHASEHSCRWTSPYEREMKAHVDAVIAQDIKRRRGSSGGEVVASGVLGEVPVGAT